jgi:hypothetical protein
MGKKIKRQRMMSDYKKFCAGWVAEAKYRESIGSKMLSPRRPTFAEWAKVMKKKEMRLLISGKTPEPELEDLEWKE